MALGDAVHIEGLRELKAALRRMENGSQRQLRVVLNESADLVSEGAKPRVAVQSGRARGSIRASSTQNAASVKGGGARAPYYPWLDFGGSVGRKRRTRRPFIKDGRYIYASYRDRKARIREAISDGLERLIRESGLNPS